MIKDCSTTDSLVNAFLRCLGAGPRLWPSVVSFKLSLFDLIDNMTWFAPQPPACAMAMSGELHSCSNGICWKAACGRINDAGRNALLEMGTLNYSTKVNGYGNPEGFTTEGEGAWTHGKQEDYV